MGAQSKSGFDLGPLAPAARERLARRHGMTVALTSRKRSPSHEIDEAAVKTLRAQADLVVSGIGD